MNSNFSVKFNSLKFTELELTAAYWAGKTQPKVIEDPLTRIPISPNVGTLITPVIPVTNNTVIEEPNENVIEKKAHRRLRIRKKKMKVHRRKRRWKKNW